jgi:hypothetical protein
MQKNEDINLRKIESVSSLTADMPTRGETLPCDAEFGCNLQVLMPK